MSLPSDMNLLLRDRTKVLQALLAHLSAIQLHLFAKMYVTLRKSDAMTRIFPTLAAAKTPSDGLQTVIGKWIWNKKKAWMSVDPLMSCDLLAFVPDVTRCGLGWYNKPVWGHGPTGECG